MLGDFLLYSLAPMELSQPVYQRPIWSITTILNNATIQGQFVVPDDKIAILQDFAFIAQGGGGQTVTTMQARIFADDGLNQTNHFLESTVALAVATRTVTRSLFNPVVMPGEVIHAIATFSAGAVNNTFVFTVMGLLLPKGNFQFR